MGTVGRRYALTMAVVYPPQPRNENHYLSEVCEPLVFPGRYVSQDLLNGIPRRSLRVVRLAETKNSITRLFPVY